MDADIHTLFESDFYRILDFKCRCTDCKTSSPEYAESFCISFIRKGNFLFNVSRNSFDAHTGRTLVTKPGYEHTVNHTHSVPDECTIFDFDADFYEKIIDYYGSSPLDFFKNHDLHSIILATKPETEYLHHTALLHALKHKASRFELDSLVLEILHHVLSDLSCYDEAKRLKAILKKNHLTTIEAAKAYMISNFAENISLKEIADHCCISIFHFSRIFKSFTSYSPNRFLINLRLKNAEVLTKNTSLSITEICFASGFNSLEYFSAAFVQKYGMSPTKFRTARKIDPTANFNFRLRK